MAFRGSVEDRLAIRELMGAYSDSAFRGDAEDWLACWTDDAVRTQGGHEVRGKAALRRMWDGLWGAIDRMAFFGEVASIEVAGDTAKARVYTREIIVLKDGGFRKVVGLYDDDLVREAGVWRFARREYQLLMDEGAAPRPG